MLGELKVGQKDREGGWRPLRKISCGKGINDARRVLEAIGTEQDDVVFISADPRTQIMKNEGQSIFNPPTEHMDNRGRKKDKHGGFHRVYEVNHSAWLRSLLY